MPVWEDLPNCVICNAEFSVTNRRHHCRPCGRCVCKGCSPSSIVMEGLKGMQRACNPCIAATANVRSMSNNLAEFGASLHAMCGVKLDVMNKFDDVEDAITFCKSALAPLQDLLADLKGRCLAAETTVAGLETSLSDAEDQIFSVGHELNCLLEDAQMELAPLETPTTLTKAIQFCEEAVKPLKQVQAAGLARALQAESAFAKEKEARCHAEALLHEADIFCTELSERLKTEVPSPASERFKEEESSDRSKVTAADFAESDESAQLHVAQANSLHAQQSLDEQASQLEAQRTFAEWVHESALSLQQRMKTPQEQNTKDCPKASVTRSDQVSDAEDSEDEIDDASIDILALRGSMQVRPDVGTAGTPSRIEATTPGNSSERLKIITEAIPSTKQSTSTAALVVAVNEGYIMAQDLQTAQAQIEAGMLPSPPQSPDRRCDFGASLAVHHCSQCQKVTLNRGSKDTGQRYCIDCYNHEFPVSNTSSFGQLLVATPAIPPGSSSGDAAPRTTSLQGATAAVAAAAGTFNDHRYDYDRRHDFGAAWSIPRCCRCQTITLNRGDQQTGQRYCLECYNLDFPIDGRPRELAPGMITQGRR